MNDDQLDDLKQFITATVSQQTSTLGKQLKDGLAETNKKIDDLSASVAHALDSSNDVVDTQLSDHELRITNLETTPA